MAFDITNISKTPKSISPGLNLFYFIYFGDFKTFFTFTYIFSRFLIETQLKNKIVYI